MTLWWRDVWCTYCEAQPGERCRSKSGRPTYAHADRLRDGDYYVLSAYDGDEDYADLSMDELLELQSTMRPPEYRSMITVYLPGDAPREDAIAP